MHHKLIWFFFSLKVTKQVCQSDYTDWNDRPPETLGVAPDDPVRAMTASTVFPLTLFIWVFF